MIVISVASLYSLRAQTIVSSLAELQNAVLLNDQTIVLTPGQYNIQSLPSNSRFFHCSGSNNTIDLRGVYIEFPVDATSDQHFLLTGSNNTLKGGVFENTYADGTEEITDYVKYNNDRNKFANGGDPHIVIQGDGNSVIGTKMTVRGSFPYGYGSIYGINNNNQFGLSKRGGIAVQGTNAVIDSCELQMRAFGHAIYIQSPSNHTIIRNTTIVGDLRLGSELLAETDPTSLPSRSNFMDFSEDHENPDPIDPNRGISLCEDGIRLYNNGGSMEVENCRVEKMRGGIRGYLGSGTTVINSTAIDCESTNFNLPNGGSITNSYGNFSYCPLSDYRLGRSNTNVELTIIPSPHASGSHNLLDLEGNNHTAVFHRTSDPVDSEETRAIVITGDNSTVTNESEYTIILESTANGNQVTSCGTVIDNGTNNTIILTTDCFEEVACDNTTEHIEAECYDDMDGIQTEDCSEGTLNVGWINDGDWMKYNAVDLTGMKSIKARVSGKTTGSVIEVRTDAANGNLIAEIPVTNTGGNQNWTTDSVSIETVTGAHDIYLVFKGETGYLFNINWLSFSEESHIITDVNNGLTSELNIYPNPTSSTIQILNEAGSKAYLYNAKGDLILSDLIKDGSHQMNLNTAPAGIYYLKIQNSEHVKLKKIIKN